MKEKNLMEDIRRADHFSFLYYLHEEKDFRVDALVVFCNYLEKMESVSIEQLRDLRWIENQILRHLVYHFDPNDLSRIRNLPTNYCEELEAFEQAVSKLYERYR
jgi:hypothetical protein